MIPYAFSALVLAGGILNIRKHPAGFLCWIISNGYFVAVTGTQGHYAEAATFAANFCLAIYGYFHWRTTHHG